MAGLIPWRKKKAASTGNGGGLPALRDFPTLMRRMQNEFDELFERFAQEWPVSLEGIGKGWQWGVDVEDKEDCVVVKAEAPGFEAGDFDVRVSGERLILRASRKTETKEKEGESREQYECYESLTLPPGTDPNKIDARYHSGVLTVTIPKTMAGKGKKIAVKNA